MTAGKLRRLKFLCASANFSNFSKLAKTILNFEFSRARQMPKEPCYTDLCITRDIAPNID